MEVKFLGIDDYTAALKAEDAMYKEIIRPTAWAISIDFIRKAAGTKASAARGGRSINDQSSGLFAGCGIVMLAVLGYAGAACFPRRPRGLGRWFSQVCGGLPGNTGGRSRR